MGGGYRPPGITAIAVSDFAIGMLWVLLFLFSLGSPPGSLVLLVLGILFIGFGLGTWVGMSWAWYLLTFGGGFFGWYFAKNDVKEFFGIRENHEVGEYSGD